VSPIVNRGMVQGWYVTEGRLLQWLVVLVHVKEDVQSWYEVFEIY
jgi:hypothetical protein